MFTIFSACRFVNSDNFFFEIFCILLKSTFSASAADRSPSLSPPKSWARWIKPNGYGIGPPTCGGTAVIGEATDGDGDENSSREQTNPYRTRKTKMK